MLAFLSITVHGALLLLFSADPPLPFHLFLNSLLYTLICTNRLALLVTK